MVIDLSITAGNLITVLSCAGMVGLYVIDTRYSATGSRAEIKKISAQITRLTEHLDEQEKDTQAKFLALRDELGKVNEDLRRKITEVELFARDNFIRKSEAEELKDTINQLRIEIKDWLVRIEARIDKEKDRASPPRGR